VPHVVVVTFTDGKIASAHIYWDQAPVLAQVGLLEPERFPVVGAGQVARLRELAEG
jgi:carboxymethylenebutenolidase